MILIDANILLYAFDLSSPYYEAARDWLGATLSEPEAVGLSWVAILAFLRISTAPGLLRRPLTLGDAVAIVSEWLERANVKVLNPSERHWEIFSSFLTDAQARGTLVTDAHLAALAIDHGATFATADRDFARFPGLSFFNPLTPAVEGR